MFVCQWCRKYHKSWSNGAAELHISVDLLCDTTAAELHNSVNLHSGLTTATELHNSVDLLCDTKATELNPVSCTRNCTHFPKTVTNHAEKYEGLIQSKNLTANFWKMNALENSAITDRCTLYEDSANFLKNERFTKTEYRQTSANLWKMNTEDTRNTTWVRATKWDKT